MNFRRQFGILCESFGGEVTEDEGILTCLFKEGDYEDYEAFSRWLFKNAVVNRRRGDFKAKFEGHWGDEEYEAEFVVSNGKATVREEVRKNLGSYESIHDWVGETLEEMGVPEEKIEELDLTPAYAEASRRVETYDYSKLPNAKPYIFMEGRVNCYTESDWNYDVERLVCYGEAQIDSSAHLPSVMDDLRNIVDKAIEVASDEWHSTFIEKVKEALARKIIAR